MTQIFISYSRAEQPIAAKLAELLTAEGYEVWCDASLTSGDRFEDEISSALRDAPAAIILWSKTAVESEWVRAEADVARRKRSAMPAVIDDVAMDRLPMLFQQLHVANLRGWTGDESAKGYRELLGEVARRLKQPPKSGAALAAADGDTKPVVATARQPLWRQPFVLAGGLSLVVIVVAVGLALHQPEQVKPQVDVSSASGETPLDLSSETSILTSSQAVQDLSSFLLQLPVLNIPKPIALACKKGETRVDLGSPTEPFVALCVGKQWQQMERAFYTTPAEFKNIYTGSPLTLGATPDAPAAAPWVSETGTRLAGEGSQTINGRLWTRKEYRLAEDTFAPELRYVYENSTAGMGNIRLTLSGGLTDGPALAELATGIMFSAVFRDVAN